MSTVLLVQWHSIAKHWEVRQDGHRVYQGKKGNAIAFAEQRIEFLEGLGREVLATFDLRGE
jgi:hypothetical protein